MVASHSSGTEGLRRFTTLSDDQVMRKSLKLCMNLDTAYLQNQERSDCTQHSNSLRQETCLVVACSASQILLHAETTGQVKDARWKPSIRNPERGSDGL